MRKIHAPIKTLINIKLKVMLYFSIKPQIDGRWSQSFFLFMALNFIQIQPYAWSETKVIEVQGHRGARGMRAENTLSAFRYALEVGVDTLEFDLAMTKDNVLVISHDPILSEKLCTFKGKKITKKIAIYNLTLKELANANCSAFSNPHFPKQKRVKDEKIPTLEEVFNFVSSSKIPTAKSVNFNIETKIFPRHPELTPTPSDFAKALVKIIEKYKLQKRTIIQSFDHRSLEVVKRMAPEIRIAPLLYYSLPDWVNLAKNLKAEIISPNKDWITRGAISKAHKAGLKVIPWTANDKDDWDRLISLGVDGIITDYPGKLIQYLKKKNLRKKAEYR